MRIQVHRGAGSLERLREPWERLAARHATTFFQSWSWVSVWHQVLEPRSEPLVVTAEDDRGELLGLLPLAMMRRRVSGRVPTGIPYVGIAGSGRGAADHLGALCADTAVLTALATAVTTAVGRRTLMLESVDPSQATVLRDATGAWAVAQTRCPALRFDDAESAESLWPRKLRENIRRRDRVLLERGVSGAWTGPGLDLASKLDALQDLHIKRWRSKGGAGLFDADRMRLLRRLANATTTPDGPWLYSLEDGTQTLGVLLGFQFGRTFATYKSGWDPAHAKLGVGIALHAAALRRAYAEGLQGVDFLRGTEPHKYMFGAVDRVDVTLIRPVGLTGRLLVAREEVGRRRSGHQGDVGASDAARTGAG